MGSVHSSILSLLRSALTMMLLRANSSDLLSGRITIYVELRTQPVSSYAGCQ
jgi:hypothetical protein